MGTQETGTQTSAGTLSMSGIWKAFPGVQALSEMDLTVAPGEIHAVVGENGAGKSTLMKILAGVHQPDEGVIEWSGEPVTFSSPREASDLGISMVYQELSLVPDLTVAENILLGRMPTRRFVINRRRMSRVAEEALDAIQARIDVRTLVGALSVSQQQMVEIARAAVSGARVVVFDEPTSSLSEHEASALFEVIRRMKANGLGLIYISHRLREVTSLADRITVMRDGRKVETRDAADFNLDDLVRLMVGRDISDAFPKRKVQIGQEVLRAEGLGKKGAFKDVSLSVRAGEIVGLAGLVGAGRTEVAQAIFGLDRADQGVVTISGEKSSIKNAVEGVKSHLAYVPEDRQHLGVLRSLTIGANLLISSLSKHSHAGVVNSRAERATVSSLLRSLAITPPDPTRRIDTLSGGNQQKIVFGRWLATKPTVMILDEPTRGIDVASKAEIHSIIGELVEAEVGILLISSELPEILAVSDRIYVLHEGEIVAELHRGEASEEAIMRAATGGDPVHAA